MLDGIVCGESVSQRANTASNTIGIVITSVIISILILVVVTVLALVFWQRRRTKEPVLRDNIAYHSHNTQIMTDVITDHRRVNTNILAATNVTVSSVSTFPNPAYRPVPLPRENVDIATATNMAYVATDITTSVNPVYHLMRNDTNNCRDAVCRPETDSRVEYDYPRQW